jgi:hypothetical protein
VAATAGSVAAGAILAGLVLAERWVAAAPGDAARRDVVVPGAGRTRLGRSQPRPAW